MPPSLCPMAAVSPSWAQGHAYLSEAPSLERSCNHVLRRLHKTWFLTSNIPAAEGAQLPHLRPLGKNLCVSSFPRISG